MNSNNRLFSIYAIAILILILCGCSNRNIEYYPNGNVKTEYSYDEDGMKHGYQTSYSENGNIQGYYEWSHGKPHGVYEEYFESGRIKIRAYYHNGVQVDSVINYYESGIVESIVPIKDGKEDGLFRSYYRSGNLQMIAEKRKDTTLWYIDFEDSDKEIVKKLGFAPNLITCPDTINKNSIITPSICLSSSRLSNLVVAELRIFRERNQALDNLSPTHVIIGEARDSCFFFNFPHNLEPNLYYVRFIIGSIQQESHSSPISILDKIYIK